MSKTIKASFIVLVGLVIIAAGVVGGAALMNRCSNKTTSLIPGTLNIKKGYTRESTITVKGVAEKEVVSDVGAFTCSIACQAQDIKSGYVEINRLHGILMKKFAELGIKPEWIENDSIDFGTVSKTVNIQEGDKKITKDEFSHYRFTRTCRVRSSDVRALENASVKLYDLTQDGIDISVSSVEYFISNLEQYKLELVDAATQSAYKRANVVANSCGSKLGKLLTARQGVIQITRPASNDTSDYGMYDTHTINKVMRLVVTLDFALE